VAPRCLRVQLPGEGNPSKGIGGPNKHDEPSWQQATPEGEDEKRKWTPIKHVTKLKRGPARTGPTRMDQL